MLTNFLYILVKYWLTKLWKIAIAQTITIITKVQTVVEIFKLSFKLVEDIEAAIVVEVMKDVKYLIRLHFLE